MTRLSGLRTNLVAIITLIWSISQGSALAGPPLLCHTIEIGDAKSLPWGSGAWANQPIARLADDTFVSQTLALLSPDAGVIVRMETIRRATIHAAEHSGAGKNLLAALKTRWMESESSKKPDGLAYFDYGYTLASYAQMNMVTNYESSGSSGADRKRLPSSSDPDAYALVLKALEIDDEKGSIEFALALITSDPSQPAHHDHLKQALGCVGPESLLAKNLVKRFGDERTRTLDDLRRTYWSQGDAERR